MGEWGWARYERVGSGTYREVSAAYLRDYVPVRAVPACGEGKMAVSGWEGTGEAVGQPRRVPNRDATSYLAGSRLLSPAHVPQRMRQVQTLNPFQDLPTEGAIGRRPHHKPSLSVLRRRRLHRTRRVGLILDGAQNYTRRKVFGFPRHSRCARWTKRLGRMRR